jgi:pimeloyl-ACP methyl ester carboxylesterase
MDHVDFYEKALLAPVQTRLRQWQVAIRVFGEAYEINTLETFPEDNGDLCEFPLVMVHGLGGGVGIWVKNIDALSKKYKIFMFDCLGFGKSSHPNFPREPGEVEALMVEAIEQWRLALGLEKIILLGHSFGGYQVACYALQHPRVIKHLILADPWGFPIMPERLPAQIPLKFRVVASVLKKFAPFALLRYGYFLILFVF